MLISVSSAKSTSGKNLESQIIQATSFLLPRLAYDSHRIEAYDSLVLPLDQVQLTENLKAMRLNSNRY